MEYQGSNLDMLHAKQAFYMMYKDIQPSMLSSVKQITERNLSQGPLFSRQGYNTLCFPVYPEHSVKY